MTMQTNNNTNAANTINEYHIIVSGIRFEFLLCSVWANDLNEARKIAKREVEPDEKYRVSLYRSWSRAKDTYC